MPDFTTIEELVCQLAEKLASLNHSLSTAESCTGGGIGQALTSVAGSSSWYRGGIIAYSNAVKEQLLNVPPDVLTQYGAVSEQVASYMALGVCSATGSSLSVSTTGIAGPEGGTEEKPVGTVCFGWSVSEMAHTETLYLSGDRQSIRKQSIQYSIKRLMELI